MAINSVTPGTTTPSSASSSNSLSSATANEQQDRFMKLLVAQMQNQDPLNPMDNAQMTSQIAQINTVSGIEKLNRTVETLLGGFYALPAQSATQLAGKSVLVEGTALNLADGKATGGIELAAAADTVNVDIVDATGATVQTIAMGQNPAGVRSFTWDGMRADGKAAADGAYKMRVTAMAGTNKVDAVTLTTAKVNSVATSTAGLQVDLGPNGLRPYNDVKSFL